MSTDNIIRVVVCGEVDHGKSTLLGRLLMDANSLPEEKIKEVKRISRVMGKDFEPAFLLDQFKEERDEERTIDTTQVFFKTKKRRYCLVDTPGHIEFIKNMMTGATQAQAALLVVDITRGLQEQTRRHARLLKMFGVAKIIVVINKMDAVDFCEKKFNDAKRELKAFLEKIGFTPLAIIPIAAKQGCNILRDCRQMKWHRGLPVVGALDSLRSEKTSGDLPLRFPVQDVYRLGDEDVCAGRLGSGVIKTGQKVVVLPSGKITQVHAIKVFGSRRDCARAGENIGLILKDAACKRGDIVCDRQGSPFALKRLEGQVFWFADRPLKVKDHIKLRCLMQETRCVVERIFGHRLLEKNEFARVSFRLAGQMISENFSINGMLGRFVLEIEDKICGVGITGDIVS